MRPWNVLLPALLIVLPAGFLVTSQSRAQLAECEFENDYEKMMCERQMGLEKRLDALEKIHLGGALRYNYIYRDWLEDEKKKGGTMSFELLRFDINGEINDILISAQYRFYHYQDVIHHGWIGYNWTDEIQTQLGVSQVPFGILPYASHSWWFGAPFYLGLEDDYDLGIKMIAAPSPFEFQLAFYKNAEWGSPDDLARYSFDVVKDRGESNEEVNQLNGRAAYSLVRDEMRIEFGLSGQLGQLYNSESGDLGSHWAAAAHIDAYFGPLGIMLEAIRYQYDPNGPPAEDDDVVIMGAYLDSHPMAANAWVYVANVSYEIPVDLGPVDKITFYNDYSLVVKDEKDSDRDIFEDSQINTAGFLISSGPVYTYVDFYMGRNMVWLGPDHDGGLGAGSLDDKGLLFDDDWHTRFNVNVGYYF